MFGNLFKKRKTEISKEMFGQRVLSRMLLTSAKQSPDLFEELGVEMTFTHYLLYLEYLLFLSKKILSQRYSASGVDRIINATIYGLIDFMDAVPADKKDEVKSLFWAMYHEFEEMSEKSAVTLALNMACVTWRLLSLRAATKENASSVIC